MFCPIIKEDCRQPDCVRWNAKAGKCFDVIMAESYGQSAEMIEAYGYYIQFIQLSWKLEISRLLKDPTIPEEVKEAIQETKDAAALEKLLKDSDLI